MELTYDLIAKRIDHSLLGPALTTAELRAGCPVGRRLRGRERLYQTLRRLPFAADMLRGTGVAVGTTIGFPHGGHASATKVFESERAMDDGAAELDMVVNIGQVLSEDWTGVASDIAGVTDAAHRRGAIVKVIFENCFLKPYHIEKLCLLCGEARAD